jgi:F0F1-type ATP synthase assembly protein I
MADDGTGNGGKRTGGGKGPLGDLVKAESMIQLATALPAGCLIGWVAGSWLDRHFHQDWISIAGIVLGAVGGFIQIFTTASKFLKKDQP